MEKVAPGNISLGTDEYRVTIRDRSYTVTVLDDQTVRVDDRTYAVNIRESSPGVFSLILDSSVYEVIPLPGVKNGDDTHSEIAVNGVTIEAAVDDHRSLLRKGMLQSRPNASINQAIRAPMPGKVVRVEVQAGDRVNPGTGLIILEAMKMENEIKSAAAGVVVEVKVGAGKAVEKGELLMSIHPE